MSLIIDDPKIKSDLKLLYYLQKHKRAKIIECYFENDKLHLILEPYGERTSEKKTSITHKGGKLTR